MRLNLKQSRKASCIRGSEEDWPCVEPSRHLRVVIVDEELPYPPVSGKRIRILNLIGHLGQRHDITLICHPNPDREEIPAARSHLESLGIASVIVPRGGAARLATVGRFMQPVKIGLNLLSAVPYSAQWHRCPNLRRTIEEYAKAYSVDVWQCEWAPYTTNFLSGAVRPWVMMAHDIQSSIWQRHHEAERSWAARAYIGRQWQRYRRFEKAAFSAADMTITVTEENAKLARDQYGARKTHVVENGVDVAHYQSRDRTEVIRDPSQVIFVGNLQWRPNLDAVRQLLDEVFPRVASQEPRAKLVIVGRSPPNWLRQRCKAVPRVELHADVADVRPYLRASGMMAVPLRFGSGSRLKILEALATGLPVVSSSVGAEGLRLKPGTHYAQADSSEEMARTILDWIRDPQSAAGSASAGRKVVEQKYDWSILAAQMEQAWHVVAREASGVDKGSRPHRLGAP